jgi:hypothetical protein
MVALGMRLMAAGPIDRTTLRSPSFNILVRPSPGITAADLPDIADSAAAQFTTAGGQVEGRGPTKVGALRAYRMNLSLRFKLPTGTSAPLSETQYYVVAKGFAYIITTTGTSPDLARIVQTFSPT